MLKLAEPANNDAKGNPTPASALIIGPSHAVRWEHAVKSGALDAPFARTQFLGKGGAPIWSRDLFDQVKSLAGGFERLLYIVGDFRFGNALSQDPRFTSREVFQPGFRNIDGKYLDAGIDERLYQRSLEALDQWKATFGDRIEIVHWTLLLRRALDRVAGRHVGEDGYRHPTFDPAPILKRGEGADLVALDGAPDRRILSLCVDDNLHPSPLGYKFLEGRARGLDPVTALRQAEAWLLATVEAWVAETPPRGKVLICGDSIWVKSAAQVFIERSRQALEKAGIFIRHEGSESLKSFIADNGIDSVYFVTRRGPQNVAWRPDQISTIAPLLGLDLTRQSLRVVPWEAIGTLTIHERHEDLLSGKPANSAEVAEWVTTLDAPEALTRSGNGSFDLGLEYLPTLLGYAHLIKDAANAPVKPAKFLGSSKARPRHSRK